MAPPPATADDPAKEFVERVRTTAKETGNETLQQFVTHCDQAHLLDQFLDADAEANALQRTHRHTVQLAVWPGMVALLLGIVQLGFHGECWTDSRWTLGVEVFLIALSVGAVVLGIYREWHKRWLLRRYQAERFRLLIFDLAIDPELWTGKQPRGGDWEHWIRPPADAIDNLTVATFEHEAHREEPPRVPTPSACQPVRRKDVKDLIHFYSRTWLDSQVEYFGKKIRDAERRSWIRPGVVSLVFAASCLVVFVHVTLVLTDNKKASHWFLLLAALLPAAFASLRTWKSALEISRNAARAVAKRAALIDLEEVIHREDHEQRPDEADAVWFDFKNLAVSQALLRSEQREWLRLMLEAEWIG